ncbi:calmin isoform X2 [Pleurodeles waltl]|uniref:calmin isoform X2 n=1 Tax=Pleurodeles waltl TaxID=8319 RepID=UPI00370980AF
MEHRKELLVERENIQKRTFTRWINLHLEKCEPPLEVHDLFLDIQDGKVLMALLEVMSGQRLLHEYKSSSHRIFRLNNIAKSLKFLEESNVKLVSIDAAEIADGNPSMVLGLIWNIILFFQIKELTGNLNHMSSSSSLSSFPSGTDSDTSHPSTPNTEKTMSLTIKDQRKAIKALLHWVQQRTRKYGVAVQDFATSWRSGLAFLAIIKAIDSSLVDMKDALDKSPRENLENAFRIAFQSLNIPRLLEPEDIMVDSPDEQSIMTYVAQFLEHFPDLEGDNLSEADSPVESTYVHYKDGPVEEEGKVVIFNQSQEYAYTVNHESLQPPPPKIFVCSVPETTLDCTPEIPFEALNERISSALTDKTQPQQDDLKTAESHKAVPKAKIELGDVDPTLDTITDGLTSLHLTSSKLYYAQKNNTEDSQPNLSIENNVPDTVNCSKYSKMSLSKKCTEPQFSAEDHIDAASSPFSTLNPLLGNSNESPYKVANKLIFGKPFYSIEQTGSGASNVPMPSVSPVTPTDEEDAYEEDAYKYILHLQDDLQKKSPMPLGYEHPNQMSAFQEARINTVLVEDVTHRGHPDLFRSTRSEGAVQSHTPIPASLNIRTSDEVVPKTSPGPAKVSVIPHDLFYYPHYSVPIADVLDAFVEFSAEESAKNKLQSEPPLHFSPEQPMRKTSIDVSPTKASEPPSETLLKEGHFITTPGISIFSSNVANINQIGQTNANSDIHNHNTKKKEDSVCNGEARTPPYLQVDENHVEDSTERTMGHELHDSKRKQENSISLGKEGGRMNGRFPVLQPEEENIGGLSSSRTSQSDTSIHYRRHEHVADGKDTVYWRKHENSESVEEVNPQVRLLQEGLISVSAIPNYNYQLRRHHTIDFFYFFIFLWMVVYGIMILPELDIDKVTFFSHDQ